MNIEIKNGDHWKRKEMIMIRALIGHEIMCNVMIYNVEYLKRKETNE